MSEGPTPLGPGGEALVSGTDPVENPVVERRLRSDVFLTLGARVTALLINFASSVIIARALGAGGRGSVAVAYTLSLVLVQFGTFGLATANPYFAAQKRVALARIVTNSVWFAGTLGAALILAGVGVKLVFPTLLAGLTWTQLAIALAGIPAALLSLFLQSILLGVGRMVAYNVVELSLSIASLLVLGVGLLVFGLGVTGTLAILVASQVASALSYLVLVRPDLRLIRRFHTQLAIDMLTYGFRIYVAGTLAFLVIRSDILLVNGYIGRTEAGVYSIAVAFGEALYILPTVVGLNLFARVARGASDRMSAEVFRSMFVLYGIVCLVSVALAGPLIHAVYGPQFSQSVGLYYWLAPGIFSLGMLTILSQHFAGRGFPMQAMLVWFVGFGLNLGLNVAFLQREGTYFASLSSSIAYTVLLVLHVRLFAKDYGGYKALRPRLWEVVRFVRVAFSRS
jgi:O-antigen/teichoic acid export membrane protein